MKKLNLLLCWALLIFVFGCSSPPVVPDERGTMDEFFAGLEIPVSVPGYYTITDIDGNIVAEGTLILNDDGSYSLGEIRQGDKFIGLNSRVKLTGFGVKYLNPAWYTADGIPMYYIGSTMKYEVFIYNEGCQLLPVYVLFNQRYWGGPHHLELLPGQPGYPLHKTPLDYGANYFECNHDLVPGTIPGQVITWVKVLISLNVWQLYWDLFLLNNPCGFWDQ